MHSDYCTSAQIYSFALFSLLCQMIETFLCQFYKANLRKLDTTPLPHASIWGRSTHEGVSSHFKNAENIPITFESPD